MTQLINSYDFASEGRGVTSYCGRFQCVHPASCIKGYAKNSGKPFCENAHLTTWCDLADFGGTWNNRKCVKVSHIEVTAIGHCTRHDMALACRNVTDAGYLTFRCDLIQFPVVWF